MNNDILAGKWKQLRGEIQRRWGKLTNDELDEINGSYDKLAGKLQECYGIAKDAVDRDLRELEKASKPFTDSQASP